MFRNLLMLLGGLAAVLSSVPGVAGEIDAVDHLPPTIPWNGKSRDLVLPPDHEWVTPSERSGLTTTPRYDETIEWLRRLVKATPDLERVSIGKSAEGRDVFMVIASRGESKTPEALLASGKPIVLAQAGIHSGEIDGKDAGLMLLRDMTVVGSRRALLDKVHLLFIPVLSVDGHERFSRYSRINQRGPVEMGWRTNARNLNLNRDYTKLEIEEMRAVVGVINRWRPDLYIDLHVTDGMDYQYDVTWGMSQDYAWSPAISRWVEATFTPTVTKRLTSAGHVPGPFVWPRSGRDLSQGVVVWTGTPRFSNVYGAVRHLPTILVENHSLKPYDQRVLGTYVFLEAALELVASEKDSLRDAMGKDRARRPDTVILEYQWGDDSKVETLSIKGVSSEIVTSPVTGGEVLRFTGEPEDREVNAFYQSVPKVTVDRPAAYYIPAGWSHIADKLRLHGIEVELLPQALTVDAQVYRLPTADLAGGGSAFDERSAIYEGRIRIDPGEIVVENRSVEMPAGSYRVSTDQPLGELAVMLLEPVGPDSFFQWGYFIEILSRTEYAEAYIMEPVARAMLEDDPALAAEFEKKLANDAEFAADPRARLHWFYTRTPYFDASYRLYPIARAESE
jgi:murein tripeptide amidase MpaA